MTAVVGILNKHGAAIAADSAVTINGPNGKKILNSANKIFTLSKHHPVGVMIYNSADFMTTPWEVIIKSYRKNLAATEHNTVEEYSQDFISYLRAKSYFTDSEFQRLVLQDLFLSIFNLISNLALNDGHSDQKTALKLLKTEIEKIHTKIPEQAERCVDFREYTLEEFNAYSASVFDLAYDYTFTNNGFDLGNEYKDKLKDIVFEHIRSKDFLSNFTGLIFVGFGKEQIYPSLIPVNISGVFDNRLRYYIEENRKVGISNSINSAICPFAQTDVIDTILSGIDPELDKLYHNQLYDFFTKYNKEIANIVRENNMELANQIQNIQINDLLAEYINRMQEVKQLKYINPLMNAVATLSKDDLSEMAESLIYLTYLKRRITFAEESVGGPVDVALISKGDGFIWMKRKHYFKQELNHHFFANYKKI